MTERRTVQVCAHWVGIPKPVVVGMLHAVPVRGKEVVSFEYAREWLDARGAPALDPALPLVRGPQYPPAGRQTFGVFLDSSPDRWGRLLLRRREALRARVAGRRPRTLLELDDLLGVFDGHRIGGLRYRLREDGPFLDDDAVLASPPWAALRDLEQASLALEREGAETHRQYAKWLNLLIAPGRSLGGARPKASVVDEESRLWIAKFPSRADDEDVGAWEAVALTLARAAGIRTPEFRAARFASKHHTLLSARFDRSGAERIHFASAMTMLQRSDGEVASYLDIAQAVVQNGASPAADLEELWRRIVFFLCVSNVDDHLRNHGFLLEAKGWRLAPVYDVNPVANASGLTLNVSTTDNALDLSLAFEVASSFRLKPMHARKILSEVRTATRSWRRAAKSRGLSRASIDRMAPAFSLADV